MPTTTSRQAKMRSSIPFLGIMKKHVNGANHERPGLRTKYAKRSRVDGKVVISKYKRFVVSYSLLAPSFTTLHHFYGELLPFPPMEFGCLRRVLEVASPFGG